MRRRETYEPVERPARPRRKAWRTMTAIAAAVVLTGVGTGAAVAHNNPGWNRAVAEQRLRLTGRHQIWKAHPIRVDSYTVATARPGSSSPRPTLGGAAPASSSAPASSTPATSSPSPSTSAGTSPSAGSGNYGTAENLFAASSPWNTPIGPNAAIDPQSAAISSKVLNNPSLVVNLDLISYGQPFFTATASTPRVVLGGRGGGAALGSVPLDPSWNSNAGADSKMNIVDPTTHTVFELQGFNAAAKSVYWAVKHDYTTALGDGYPTNGERKGPTGSAMSQAAGTIRASDLKAGEIDHALSFISSMPVAGFRYPASQSDGRGSGVGIQEGMRVQLDPSVDVDAIGGLTSGEKMVMKALQKYGAYCSDTGQGNNQAMGFYVEKPNSSNQATFDAAGLTRDWQILSKIPRDKLRVLAESATPRP